MVRMTLEEVTEPLVEFGVLELWNEGRRRRPHRPRADGRAFERAMDGGQEHRRLRALLLVVVGPLALDERPDADRPTINQTNRLASGVDTRRDRFADRRGGRGRHRMTPLEFCQLSPRRPDPDDDVADAECRRLLTSVKTNSGTVQVRRPITLDGLTHIRCQRRVHERHRDMLDHATRWSRNSAENSSPRARPPDYDESSARRDHQASAAVIALSASRMPPPTSPAVAAQCRGTRARAPGSQRCSSRVSGSGAVPS